MPMTVRSVKELLNDRSLESKFQFDDDDKNNNKESLPDLVALQQQQQQSTSSSNDNVGKKRARQQARRTAAQAAQDNDDDVVGMLLSKLPGIRDENGKISPLKILENSTWVCIGLLVLWEIYLNSPFFERAAPMAPIVYQFFL